MVTPVGILLKRVQEAFADIVDVHRTYMGGLERGERNLTLKNLEHIAEVLGIDVREMLKR